MPVAADRNGGNLDEQHVQHVVMTVVESLGHLPPAFTNTGPRCQNQSRDVLEKFST